MSVRSTKRSGTAVTTVTDSRRDAQVAADPNTSASPTPSAGSREDRYTVVARRYRPQSFEGLIGQGLVAQALSNAILSNRVGHAYLFTGARGVGKTSTARIFAKALNCQQGPTVTPCNACDPCLGIATGEDVDVIEIDGASNRGIDEIRQLRGSVAIRPSRTRYKIYIIDEVHMLTREAFNALLKTLEEPPEHVKFIFCTTSPEKIPITVLSRCQRFDFVPVAVDQIGQRLKEIVTAEGAQAEDDALELLARRAGGSVRDSQSLLEQILSFCDGQITTATVHAMLGTADNRQLIELMQSLAQGEPGRALHQLNDALRTGVDIGQFAEQLLGMFRDMMVHAVGGDPSLFLHVAPGDVRELQALAVPWGLPRLLAASQIIDECLVRMRQSGHARTLLELALVRVAQLDDWEDLQVVVEQLRGNGVPVERVTSIASVPGKKKTELIQPESTARAQSSESAVDTISLDTQSTVPANAGPIPGLAPPVADRSAEPIGASASPNDLAPVSGVLAADEIWRRALDQLGGMAADMGRKIQSVTAPSPARLVVTFPEKYNSSKAYLERTERLGQLERVLQAVTGQTMRVEFVVDAGKGGATPPTPAVPSRISPRDLLRQVSQHPLVQQAAEIFSAEVTDVRRDPGGI